MKRKVCAKRLEMRRLSKAERKKLYQTIRFVHMSHEELIKLQSDSKYDIAKDQLLEALSFKLNNYENAIKEELKLNNRDYRVNYEPGDMSMRGSNLGEAAAHQRNESNAVSDYSQYLKDQAKE